jgi:glycosyltransferase involved in cell wall biosynthesis
MLKFMQEPIPCTVAILTKDSGQTLDRALASMRDFADIIVCDGGSTDDTLAIAAKYGARVIQQDRAYIDGEGRLSDFAGVRNQTLAAAQQPWFFFLDSDEYASPELVAEIRSAVSGASGAYWVPRKYVLDGVTIDCSITYPNRQMRFFHRDLAQRFIKPVHERILLKTGTEEKELSAPLLVPVTGDTRALRRKWNYYLALEHTGRGSISFRKWVLVALKQTGIAVLYVLRLLKVYLWCRGTRQPLRVELMRFWYQWAYIRSAASDIGRF